MPNEKNMAADFAEIDDAAVGRIEQFWRGGKTIPENAQRTHRHCNVSRSRKIKHFDL